jgi:hypothetical protein
MLWHHARTVIFAQVSASSAQLLLLLSCLHAAAAAETLTGMPMKWHQLSCIVLLLQPAVLWQHPQTAVVSLPARVLPIQMKSPTACMSQGQGSGRQQ